MTLSIKINGVDYKNFTSASTSASIAAVTRGFSFVSTVSSDNLFPLKVGDEVEILADNISFLTGYIESLEISYDSASHEIRVSGRSKLADLVDSSVPTQFEFKGTTLDAIAYSLLKSIGISAKVINEAGSIRGFSGDITSAEIGQNAFDFLEKYSRKRQVLLTTDGADGLVFTRTGVNNAANRLKNVPGGKDNNILKASIKIDNSKRFFKYVIKAQMNPIIEKLNLPPIDLSDQEGQAFDKDMRESRKIEINGEESMDSFSASDRAVWEKNLRIGTAFSYQVTVVGNSVDGKLWLPNTLVSVRDDFCQINATLLIKEVRYDFDSFSGSTTELMMIKKEAYTLEVEQSQRDANKQKTDGDFVT